jgi:hypothetical protein
VRPPPRRALQGWGRPGVGLCGFFSLREGRTVLRHGLPAARRRRGPAIVWAGSPTSCFASPAQADQAFEGRALCSARAPPKQRNNQPLAPTKRREARLEEWRAVCAAVAARRDAAAAAKARAEAAAGAARTQQDAERAEAAVREAAAELKARGVSGCSQIDPLVGPVCLAPFAAPQFGFPSSQIRLSWHPTVPEASNSRPFYSNRARKTDDAAGGAAREGAAAARPGRPRGC